nr:MAG TPA: protein of unknown function (DUF4355) [Caudoviricetes sp.]
MADQPRNVRDADEDAKPQPGATATKQDTPAVQTEPDAKPQPGAKPANDPPAKPAADTPEPKPTEEDSQAEPKPTEEVKLEDPRIADLQAKLAAATAQACAVRALAEAGLPVNLADLVTGGAPEDITANVEALAQAIDAAASQRNAPAQPSLPPDAEEPEEDMRARARRIFA